MNDPRRVTVSGPRAGAPKAVPHWPVARDIDEQTELGVLYVRSLIRAQLRTSVLTCAAVTAVITGLLLWLWRMPGTARVRVLEIPLSWLILGLGVQPVWVGLALWHVRRTERTERAFAEFVE